MNHKPTDTAEQNNTPQGGKGVVAGIVVTLLFHSMFAVLLAVYVTDESSALPSVESARTQSGRRAAAPETMYMPRKRIVGPYRRTVTYVEVGGARRTIAQDYGRRNPSPFGAKGYRTIDPGFVRRLARKEKPSKRREIDWGQQQERQIIEAMVIPRLGYKKPEKKKLPKLLKYEQPEKFEEAINITRQNPTPKKIKHKARKHKKAQLDRRRKKPPSLSELIDAPEDQDPRKRPTRLSEIIGHPEGSPWGDGTEFKPGNIYLAKIERKIRRAFKIPVYMPKDELKKYTVEILIEQMDPQGHILKFKIKRRSRSSAYNSAALEAIKRFVPSEGGSLVLPPPPPAMLELINQKGLLIRLEGRRFR